MLKYEELLLIELIRTDKKEININENIINYLNVINIINFINIVMEQKIFYFIFPKIYQLLNQNDKYKFKI